MKKMIIAFLYLSIICLSCKKGKEDDPSKAVLTEIETTTQTFKLLYNENGQLHKAEYYTILPGNQDKRLKEIIEYTYNSDQLIGFKTYTVNAFTQEQTLTGTTKLIYDNTGQVVSSEHTGAGASMPSLITKWTYSGNGKPSGFQSTDINLPDIKYIYGSPRGGIYLAPTETINSHFDIKYSTTPNYFADKQVVLQLYYAFHINFVFIADFFSEYYPKESRMEIRSGNGGGGLITPYPKTIITTEFKYYFSSGVPTQIIRKVRSEHSFQEGQKSEQFNVVGAWFRYKFN